MNVSDFYRAVDGDYDDIMHRFGSEKMVRFFLQKFKADKCYATFLQALDTGDRKAVFSAIHALKGVAGNMAFTALYASASALTEKMRTLQEDPDMTLVEDIKKRYNCIIQQLEKLA